jgi:hypothetical protein
MTPEEVARRYEDLRGFELVDYSEVGLPLWQLGVEALSLAHKPLQPIKEFVLRSVGLHLSEVDIAGFLGLDPAVVRGALAELVSEKLLNSDENLEVTKQGLEALILNGVRAPIEEQLQILFDGILRKPTAAPPEEVALPRDMEEGAIVEIGALPPNRPTVGDLDIADVDHVLQEMSGGRVEMGRDILKLKRIARHRRLFRRAVGLVFKAKKGKELRVFFVVSGVRDEVIEAKFAQSGGTSRPGFVREFSDAYINANVRRHLGSEISQKLLDFSQFEILQRDVSLTRLRRAGQLRKVAAVERGEIPQAERPSLEDIEESQVAELSAVSKIGSVPARPASVYEMRELLNTALREAKKTISVSSKGLAPHIVSDKFLQNIRRLLNGGVEIKIFIHQNTLGWKDRGRAWERAFLGLEEMSSDKGSLLQLLWTREDRYYHLAWDDRKVLVCNRPFLSNHGRIKSFEQFAGFVVQDPGLVDLYLKRVQS